MDQTFDDLYTLAKAKAGCEDTRKIEKILLYDLYPLLPFHPSLQVLETIDVLSSMPYEQSKCIEKHIAFFSDVYDLNIDIKLDEQIEIEFDLHDIDNKKVLRKLINPVPEDCCYVFAKKNDNDIYYAIGSTRIDKLKEKLYYECTIIDEMKWKLAIHCPNVQDIEFGLFSSDSSRYREYDYGINIGKKSLKIDQNIDQEFNPVIMQIYDLFNEYIDNNSKCGTSFVIFKDDKDASDEAKRLAGGAARGYLLKQKSLLSEDILKQIINIDGGIIVDKDGFCYAYGCIFDGTVPIKFLGDRSSGARHNSVQLYVENKNPGSCVGLVFSEDGGEKLYYKL